MKLPALILPALVAWGSLSSLAAQVVPGEPTSEPPYAATLLVDGQTRTEEAGTFTSSAADTSAIAAVGGALVWLNGPKVVVTGASSNDETSNLWGTTSGILASGASRVTVVGGMIRTSGVGSNAVFSTGKSTIEVSEATIVTARDSSRGMGATRGGSIVAKDVSVTTSGALSPAIAADQGDGTVTVVGGTMRTTGEGSPALFCAGTIRVSGAALVATGSEAAVLEGRNSMTLTDTVLVGSKGRGGLVYQGTQDSPPGTGVVTMAGGSLTALVGPLFSAANTKATANLKQVSLVQKSGELVRADGADLTLNAEAQVLNGDVVADPLSTVSLNLKAGSSWTGAADVAKAAKAISVSLEGGSVWTVGADSRVAILKVEGGVAALAKALVSGGHTVWYKASLNGWLGGKAVSLDGGSLQPY